MTHVPGCDAAMASVDVSRVVQMRALFWSMQSLIATARAEKRAPRTLLFELQALAEADFSLADCAVEESADLAASEPHSE